MAQHADLSGYVNLKDDAFADALCAGLRHAYNKPTLQIIFCKKADYDPTGHMQHYWVFFKAERRKQVAYAVVKVDTGGYWQEDPVRLTKYEFTHHLVAPNA